MVSIDEFSECTVAKGPQMLDEVRLQAVATPAAMRWWVDLNTRFGDLDSNGHVNNVAVLTYVEEARLHIRRQFDDVTGGGSWRITSSGIRYLASIGYPARLRVGVAPTDVGSSSFTLVYCIIAEDVLAAVAVSRSVHVDAQGAKAALPARLADALRQSLPG